MKTFSKRRTIASMILAPVANFLIGQSIAIVATMLISMRIALSWTGTNQEMLVAVTEEVMKYNVHLTGIASLIMIPIAYFLLYEKQSRVICKGKEYGKLLLTIPFGIAACLAVNMLISLSPLPKLFPTYENLAETIFQGNILFELVAVGVLPGIVEELIYRGILYKGFKKFVPVVAANLISSFVFGAMHMNMIQFVYATTLGIMFAWVYERYKTLWAPMLMHMFANMFSVLMTEWEPLAEFASTAYGSMLLLLFVFLGVTLVPVLIFRFTTQPKVQTVDSLL